jgi:uncharacterized protein (TIGR02271 family)
VITTEQAQQAMNKDLQGSDGSKIGTVGQIFLDDETGRPEWATVSTGTFSKKESFVPLAQAELTGDTLNVPYDKAKIKDAPQVDVDSGHLSPEEEEELYRYYGFEYQQAPAQTTDSDTDTVGRDTSGPTTDSAMTRSEEQLKVGTERRESGRARLRQYVVTENVTQTVPVSREEVRIEREPITDANRDAAMAGGEITEEEHEVVLHEERAVSSKETVPVERVRMDTETVTGQEQVSEEVRKEQIETEGVDPTSTK